MPVLHNNELVELLEQLIEDSPDRDQFGLVGFVGSSYKHLLHHDLDVLTYPSEEAQKGKFVIAQMAVIRKLQQILREEYKSDAIPFPMIELQGIVETLSKRKEGEYLMHNLIFADTKSMVERVPFFRKWLGQMKVIYGSEDALKSGHRTDMDFYYFTLINGQIYLSRLPRKVVANQSRTLCNYVNRHAGDPTLIVPDEKMLSYGEAIPLFEKTLQQLDEKATRLM